MNREIKFRGQRIDNKEWGYGYFVKKHDMCFIVAEAHGCLDFHWEVVPETVGQFTGLKDCNGVEIYECDILKVEDPYGENEKNIVVEMKNGLCQIEWSNMFNGGDSDLTAIHYAMEADFTFEVLGNIYEHPELIK